MYFITMRYVSEGKFEEIVEIRISCYVFYNSIFYYNENSLLFNLNSQKIIHMKHTNLVKLNLSEISAKNKICIIKHNINF